MPLEAKFSWNKNAFSNVVGQVVTDALGRVRADAHTVWETVVPVGKDTREHQAGTLRDSWFSFITTSAGGYSAGQSSNHLVLLVIGASAPYAIFVELGTGRMAPRAPIRRTAGIVMPLLPDYIRYEAGSRGLNR